MSAPQYVGVRRPGPHYVGHQEWMRLDAGTDAGQWKPSADLIELQQRVAALRVTVQVGVMELPSTRIVWQLGEDPPPRPVPPPPIQMSLC